MDSQNIYTRFSDIENAITKAGSKHAKLQDIQHKDIVSFNPVKKPIKPKMAEIKRKLQNLPAGVYCIVTQDRFGKNVHQENYYFGKGKYQLNLQENSNQFQEKIISSNSSENLLSLESAVENIKESANLKAENISLTKEVGELRARCAQLEADNKLLQQVNDELSLEEEVPGTDMFGGLKSFFSELAPILPSLADQYFASKKQENELKQAKLLMENGYEIPGLQKVRPQQRQQQQAKQMPEPGTPEWEDYVAEVAELPEGQFEQHLELIRVKFPHLYEPLCSEVYEEDEEGAEG